MIGRTLSHFRISAKLGEGGMGEVWLAEDTKLGREVAIKVLPEEFASDSERLSRFEREARVLASLSHPHIASIFEVGAKGDTHFLVMELAKGEDLAARIGRGPIPIDETTKIARQIALALETAHEQGIVHRDLKPANIQVSDDGQVKVLDFGLAKAFEGPGDSSQEDLSLSPTLTQGATLAGTLLGTAAYMSPEQARGRPADRRSDIWAFGVVLWEMLTGRCLFGGETVSDSLAAILRAEPRWEELPAETPTPVRRLLRRCLERDPSLRLQHIGDARLELDENEPVETAPALAEPAEVTSSRWRSLLPWIMAIAAGIGAVLGWMRPEGENLPHRATHLSLLGGGFHSQSSAAISADGRLIAYTDYSPTLQGLLHIRSLDSGETTTFEGTEDARMPFFSPDGESVAFFQSRTERLVKVPVRGGSITSLALVAGGIPTGSWGADGLLVFSEARREDGSQYEGLMVIGESGGTPEPLTTPDPQEAHLQPLHLPGNRWLLFAVSTSDQGYRIEAVSLTTGERRVVIEDANTPQFSADHLLFYRPSSREVLASRIELDPPRVVGEPQVVVSDLPTGSGYDGAYSASTSGTLLYHPTGSSFLDSQQKRLFAASANREMEPLNVPLRQWAQPRVSPDGKFLLLRQIANPFCVLWLHDLERGTTTRLTFEFDAHNPLWHPDGRQIAFKSDDGEMIGVVETTIDGTNDRPQRLVARPSAPQSWSPDGRRLIYSIVEEQSQTDLWTLDIETGEHRELLATRFHEGTAAISPDGRWFAYSSDETGRREVYVRSFPTAQGRMQVSSEGGSSPVWSTDGSRLYYQQGNAILMVRFDSDNGAPLEAGKPVFSSDLISWDNDTPYGVLADGRFVLVEGFGETDRQEEMAIILDWARGLD